VKKEKGGGKAPSLKLKMELSKIKQPRDTKEVDRMILDMFSLKDNRLSKKSGREVAGSRACKV
jgi:hypothetical protein